MKKLSLLIILVSTIFSACAQTQSDEQSGVFHSITVKLIPETSTIEVTDSITMNESTADFIFSLNANLEISSVSDNVKMKPIKGNSKAKDVGMDRDADGATINKYRIHFKDKSNRFVLVYKGIINDDPSQKGEEYQRSFKETTGIIATKGIYLAGSTYWVPSIGDYLVTYQLSVQLPKEWSSVTTGERLAMNEKEMHSDVWFCDRPQEEVYLIAAKFTQYEYIMNSGYKAMAFLRTPDEAIANKYLEVTEQYMQMYESMIGEYPYTKFALVENFWQTGYGMPSFTLLGDKIIRFPFILHSSYPHELLHNWWGNSVYVDFEKGNWCEGITAYEADHLIKEQRGQGEAYRRSTLHKFTNFVTPENDFPLSEFINRFDGRSEAIGYGKALMMFHMLRRKLGDDNFRKGMTLFYKNNKYKKASYDDIRLAMEEVSGIELKDFFTQWILRKGAPEIALENVHMDMYGGSYRIYFALKQIQKDSTFNIDVPVTLLTSEGLQTMVFNMNSKSKEFQIDAKGKPLKLVVDAQYDVFRTLDVREVPPAFSKALASKENVIILPSNASKENAKLYKEYADAWIAGDASDHYEIVMDEDLNELPKDKTPWIIGYENAFAPRVSNVMEVYNSRMIYPRPISDTQGRVRPLKVDSIKLENKVISTMGHGFMITTFVPDDVNRIMVFMVPGKKEAIPGLVRKLPHYGKYSYLAFEGDEPTNIAKGQWPVVNSPLIHVFDDRAQKQSVIEPRLALAEIKPVFSEKRMMKHIEFMASDEMKGRGLGTPELDQVADYIAARFKEYGLQPMGKSYFQAFSIKIPPNKGVIKMKNVIGIIPGSNPKLKNAPVVVSAHFDHLGLGWPDVHQGDQGKIHHGADDNASGVSIMLELAKSMAKSHPGRTIIFLAATGEEAGLLGSRYFVKHIKEYYSEPIFADINLDTDGSLFDKKLLVLNANTAKEWKFIFMGTDYTTGIKTEVIAKDLDASDQVAFIEQGIPAVQLFTGATAHYHRPSDKLETIDGPGLVKVAIVAKEVISYLAERENPMPFTGQAKGAEHGEGLVEAHGRAPQPESGRASAQSRRVSTGSVPDFAYKGEGVKLGSVIEGSAGDKAGLKAGDVITAINGEKVSDLKQYSDALKKFKPGDKIKLTILREGKSVVIPLVLGVR